jgi:hypothetical protein
MDMKFLVITAVREFEKGIKLILKKAEVKTFSYKEVTGYKDVSDEPMIGNWFASDMHENESMLFYAFVKKDKVNQVFEHVEQFNSKLETKSKIHVAVINIEKLN